MQEGKKGRLGTYCRRRQYVPMDDNMCSEGRYILSPTALCTERQYVPSPEDQVHIRGYGVVHTGGAKFEAKKRRKVYLISFDMVIKIKVVKFECIMEHSNISSYC